MLILWNSYCIDSVVLQPNSHKTAGMLCRHGSSRLHFFIFLNIAQHPSYSPCSDSREICLWEWDFFLFLYKGFSQSILIEYKIWSTGVGYGQHELAAWTSLGSSWCGSWLLIIWITLYSSLHRGVQFRKQMIQIIQYNSIKDDKGHAFS